LNIDTTLLPPTLLPTLHQTKKTLHSSDAVSASPSNDAKAGGNKKEEEKKSDSDEKYAASKSGEVILYGSLAAGNNSADASTVRTTCRLVNLPTAIDGKNSTVVQVRWAGSKDTELGGVASSSKEGFAGGSIDHNLYSLALSKYTTAQLSLRFDLYQSIKSATSTATAASPSSSSDSQSVLLASIESLSLYTLIENALQNSQQVKDEVSSASSVTSEGKIAASNDNVTFETPLSSQGKTIGTVSIEYHVKREIDLELLRRTKDMKAATGADTRAGGGKASQPSLSVNDPLISPCDYIAHLVSALLSSPASDTFSSSSNTVPLATTRPRIRRQRRQEVCLSIVYFISLCTFIKLCLNRLFYEYSHRLFYEYSHDIG